MKHISILIPEDAILGTIEGPRMLFTEINEYLKQIGNPSMFKVQLVGLTKSVPVYNGMYTVTTDVLIQDLNKTDLIIIPALAGDINMTLEKNKEFIPWIIKHYKSGAEIASLCIGAFLLASTGLLKGRQCSTHWMAANDFRKMFPDVKLVEEKVITDENGVYTSGGAFSYLKLILYLIEKYAGREAAVFCSKSFLIDIESGSQSQFIIFDGLKDHEDGPVKKVQEYIENNFREKMSVNQLATMFALSRRNLERRFKKATSNTVTEYIQRVKIEAAKKSLESARENVNEIMYNVGYSDSKAFRNIFKRVTGLSPIQYRSKFNREAVFHNI